MDTILQALLDLAGVNAALVLDASGRLAAFRGKSVYDRALCEQVGVTLVKAIDSIQLQHEEWETIAAQFSDGKLLMRSLGAAGGGGHVLAVVADSTLNSSFATVAIRVAANKLRKALEGGATTAVPAAAAAAGRSSVPPPLPASASQPLPSDSRVVANTGVSWSKAGSSVALSGISVGDPASATFLTRCTKALARAVGPMSKVYVQEAVRRISPEATYTMALKGKLVEDLAEQIEDADDRAQFLKAVDVT
jgi:predicted regulator of Ras-like GTPase activity (Roadblock/LC7/MglB family)